MIRRNSCSIGVGAALAVASVASLGGCRRPAPPGEATADASARGGPSAIASQLGTGASAAPPSSSAAAAPSAAASAVAPADCPDGMAKIPGGDLWIGAPGQPPESENSPRFSTTFPSFCLDRTEVTVNAYAACVSRGACKAAHEGRRFCNTGRPERGEHPVNCVDWHQAAGFCAARGARLPTEFEWEFVARGGARDLPYPWGEGPLDDHTCWKHAGGSCRVGEFPADAFGLVDVIGNVWEWTDSWYGEYPFPPVSGRTKVYRGGSWSRRFEKWMSPRLRNRYRPDEWGSHLGFRCALTLPGTACPFGPTEDGKGCLHGVREVDCSGGRAFNGARCARAGEPPCSAGRKVVPGHGCVLEVELTGGGLPVDLSGVSRSRSPEFDPDCAAHYPGRPQAFRYAGGTHHARNVVSRGAGCANRDVGVGWNSTCCP